jgi:hypothetical protein
MTMSRNDDDEDILGKNIPEDLFLDDDDDEDSEDDSYEPDVGKAPIRGPKGEDGLSAYQIAVENGFKGTIKAWLKSLRGDSGKDGSPGKDGKDGASGKDGKDGLPGKDGKDGSPGASLDFQWDGTKLGVKKDTDKEFKFQDLKGTSYSLIGTSGGATKNFRLDSTPVGSTLIKVSKTGGATLKTLTAGTNISLTETDNTIIVNSTGGGAAQETFETVSKNIKSWDFTLNYTGDTLTSLVYSNGTNIITKTLNYTADTLTSIVLSGNTPSGIALTKTLGYTGDNLTSIAYA